MTRTTESYQKGWGAAHATGRRAEQEGARRLRTPEADATHPLVRAGLIRVGDGPVRARVIGSDRTATRDGRLSPPKADLQASVGDSSYGISVKSTTTGQVGLHPVENMLDTLAARHRYGHDQDDLRALRLFAGTDAGQAERLMRGRLTLTGEADRVGGGTRLTPGDMAAYEQEMYQGLADWLRLGIVELTEYVFLHGDTDTAPADALWYLTGDDAAGDRIASGDDLVRTVRQWRDQGGRVEPGPSGSTIRLPFGALQAHQKRLQFTHSLAALTRIGVPFR